MCISYSKCLPLSQYGQKPENSVIVNIPRDFIVDNLDLGTLLDKAYIISVSTMKSHIQTSNFTQRFFWGHQIMENTVVILLAAISCQHLFHIRVSKWKSKWKTTW